MYAYIIPYKLMHANTNMESAYTHADMRVCGYANMYACTHTKTPGNIVAIKIFIKITTTENACAHAYMRACVHA